MPPRAVTKQAGIDEYKFRKRPPSKTGKRKRSVLHETKQWSHYLKLCSDWVTENKREHDVVAAIAGQHGVNERTLRDQWNKWKDVILSEGWNPSLVARVNKEYRGGSNRVFTVEEERVICTRLYHNRADLGLVISNKVIEHEALLLLDELQVGQPMNQRVTKISNGWIGRFKKRWDGAPNEYPRIP